MRIKLKKIIDEDGKIFSKINIFDLMVIVIIIFVFLGTVYKFKFSKVNMKHDFGLINFAVKISDVKDSSSKFYKKGLRVFDAKSKNYLGVIKKVFVKDCFGYVKDMNGKMKKARKPGRINIFLDIESNGVIDDKAYLAEGNYELKAGSDIYILTKYADVDGKIEKIMD